VGMAPGVAMSEPFNLVKLISGPFTGVYWAKILSIGFGLVLATFVGFGVWKAYFKKPEPTTSQRAEQIVNYYYQPKSTFGCASTRAWEYEKAKKGVIVNGL
jgi:hypothetical protein